MLVVGNIFMNLIFTATVVAVAVATAANTAHPLQSDQLLVCWARKQCKYVSATESFLLATNELLLAGTNWG